jgi:hypothetical protein
MAMQPAKEPPKPWSVSMFETLRPHMTNFIRTQIAPMIDNASLDECVTPILLRAPVKCGKREMVEYIAQRDHVTGSKRKHIFGSAWHRVADDEQRSELQTHNMTVFSITTQKKVNECEEWITQQLGAGNTIVIHLDECDYGTGSMQKLSQIWKKIEESNGNSITVILYSATPEEVMFSGESENDDHEIIDKFMDGIIIKYDPPAGYCGPAKFLANDLVHEATPFFHKDRNEFALSTQGKKIVLDLRENMTHEPTRNIIVLRLSYSDDALESESNQQKKGSKQNKAIYQFLRNIDKFPELAGYTVIVDKSDDIGFKHSQLLTEKIKWSENNYWKLKTSGIPIILVIDQTSSRSTEWVCHDRIYCMHDFRNKVQYSTISQAQERVNHYESRYGQFQKIQVYGHKKTFQLSSELIDYMTYLKEHEWKKKKIDVRVSTNDMYRVLNTNNGLPHPSCPESGFSNVQATRLLQEIGCYADLSLSSRVAGSQRMMPTYEGKWLTASSDSWEDDWKKHRQTNPELTDLVNVRNPFIAAKNHRLPTGEWQGQHRGWKLLKSIENVLYQCNPGMEPKRLDLGSTGGNRIKVCYNQHEELGIFVVRQTGSRMVNTLTTFKSMYKQ